MILLQHQRRYSRKGSFQRLHYLGLIVIAAAWQIANCNAGQTGGFFGNLRRRLSRRRPKAVLVDPSLIELQSNNEKDYTYRTRDLFRWRGGSNEGYPNSHHQSQQHYKPQQQQQQQLSSSSKQNNSRPPPPQQQQQPPRQGQEPPPDLPPPPPPDLPDFGEDESPYSRPPLPGQSSPQQPFYPSSSYSVNNQHQHHSPEPYPGSQQQQHGYQDPTLPPYPGDAANSPEFSDDPMMNMMMMNPDDPAMIPALPTDDVPWDDTGLLEDAAAAETKEAGLDLSSFDKDFILKGLARLYKKKILPLELAYKYGHFHSSPLSPADFDAPPAVLLLGPFSVGKTSFIKYLLGRDFPGIRVGPEPTTDRFTAILYGQDDKIIPGAALCSQNFRPFTGLNPFGNNFLSRMEGVELNSAILHNVTLIDTPGILSGAKQRNRSYDYDAVMRWFAERADLIIIMFDAHKLDISDEMKQVIELMIPHLDKIRIVLNKADTISTQQLMRVYGALMWSLGKVMNTPEVCRVYVGSFWDHPLQETDQQDLLQAEEQDLLNDIMKLPQQAVMRRINELVKRARSVKVHAYIIHYLRKQLPYNPWSRKDKQKRLIGRLDSEFLACARRYGLARGDFPNVDSFRRALYEIKDLGEFPKIDKKFVKEMDKVFSREIPDLLQRAKMHDDRPHK